MNINKEIKTLHKNLCLSTFESNDVFFNYVETKAKQEYIRLYEATKDCSGVTKDSIIMLLTMNRKHRFIPFHQFGWYWDIQQK